MTVSHKYLGSLLLKAMVVSAALIASSRIASPPAAFGWGCEGHETIALIASDNLTPNAKQQVSKILGYSTGFDELKHFCSVPPDLPKIAVVSTWADDIRTVLKSSGHWHFRDIPLNAPGPIDETSYCPADESCVTRAIQGAILSLQKKRLPRSDRKEALMFLIHFVGDLHQPLHNSDNGDRGGNCVPVKYLNENPALDSRHPEGQAYRPNLHSIWDTSVIRSIAPSKKITTTSGKSKRVVDLSAFADQLETEFGPEIQAAKTEPTNLDQWSWDSHQLALTAYDDLPVTIAPIDNPQELDDCSQGNVGSTYSAYGETVDSQYVASAGPIVKQQLAKGGGRLAGILNAIWP